MANANKPFGLRPVKWNGRVNLYSIAYNYGTALYVGDPVITSGTSDSRGIQGITLAAATGALRGAIVGIGRHEGLLANPGNLDRTYYPANGDGVNSPWYALVVDDPDAIFEVQENANGTQLAAAQIGLNQVLVLAAGNGYVSGWTLASATDATPNTTATLQVRLMGLVRRPGNTFGAYAKHYVKINAHELGTGTGGVGV